MLKPGDLVFTESPSYDRTINLLRRHGAKVVGIPLEADGPNIEALERALQKAVPKFFYVIPDFRIRWRDVFRREAATARRAGREIQLPAVEMRRIGCFGTAARKNRRSTRWHRSARCI
jgi:hypothetical protein